MDDLGLGSFFFQQIFTAQKVIRWTWGTLPNTPDSTGSSSGRKCMVLLIGLITLRENHLTNRISFRPQVFPMYFIDSFLMCLTLLKHVWNLAAVWGLQRCNFIDYFFSHSASVSYFFLDSRYFPIQWLGGS